MAVDNGEHEGVRNRLRRTWDLRHASDRFVACMNMVGALLGCAAALALGHVMPTWFAFYCVFGLCYFLAVMYRSGCIASLFMISLPLLVSLCLFRLRIEGFSVGLALLGAYAGYLIMGLEPWEWRYDGTKAFDELVPAAPPADLWGYIVIGTYGVSAGVFSTILIWGTLGSALGHLFRVTDALNLALLCLTIIANSGLSWLLFQRSRVIGVSFAVGTIVIGLPLAMIAS